MIPKLEISLIIIHGEIQMKIPFGEEITEIGTTPLITIGGVIEVEMTGEEEDRVKEKVKEEVHK